jgi:hypothetical protein
MSKKISEDKNKHSNLHLNNDKKEKKKFEATHVFEEEFWKDCSAKRDSSKELAENLMAQDTKSYIRLI